MRIYPCIHFICPVEDYGPGYRILSFEWSRDLFYKTCPGPGATGSLKITDVFLFSIFFKDEHFSWFFPNECSDEMGWLDFVFFCYFSTSISNEFQFYP